MFLLVANTSTLKISDLNTVQAYWNDILQYNMTSHDMIWRSIQYVPQEYILQVRARVILYILHNMYNVQYTVQFLEVCTKKRFLGCLWFNPVKMISYRRWKWNGVETWDSCTCRDSENNFSPYSFLSYLCFPFWSYRCFQAQFKHFQSFKS